LKVTVEFIGSLRHVSRTRTLLHECDKGFLLKDLLASIIKEQPALKQNLLDEQSGSSKAIALMLINGREISVLKGLLTALKDGDKVVFVPVTHGG
jgi:molybdopterin converting factor small subunit